MHPIHDADALLLLAITLASKRKPAAIDEIAIALGTLQPRLPAETKLLDAFERLSSHGLVAASEAGYALSIEGEKQMQGVSARGETAERAEQLKERLAACNAKAKHPASKPDAGALSAAIAAWRASLPPPTKSEKVAEQREVRLREENARRIAEGKPPRSAKPAGPRRFTGKRPGPKRGARESS